MPSAPVTMAGHAIGSLPVVERGKLVGILTTADLVTLISKGSTHPAPNRERQVLAKRGLRKRPAAS
jgi:CBS domain-containing protein